MSKLVICEKPPATPRTIKDRLQAARAEIATPKQDGVQRLVDIAAKRAEGKGKGYPFPPETAF